MISNGGRTLILADPALYLFAIGTFLLVRSVFTDPGNLFPVAIFYWIESAVIGAVTVMKMRRARKPNPPARKGVSSGSAVFFLCVLLIPQGLFLFFLSYMRSGEMGAFDFTRTVLSGSLLISFGLILGRHVADYVQFLRRGHFETIAPADVQGWTFLRLLVFHMSLVIGLVFFGSLFAVLIAFLALKVVAEILVFLSEHRGG